MQDISISPGRVYAEKGVVILPIEEYRRLLRDAAQGVYLTGKEAGDLDRLVRSGVRARKVGRTKKILSLAGLR